MIRSIKVSLAAMTCAIFALAACATSQGTATSTLPIASSGPLGVATPTPMPTPSIQVLADGGTMFPGTYRTAFVPAMALTINHLVDLDCSPGYRCRGDIDVNIEHWVGLEFGNIHGSELDVVRVDKVPAKPGGTTLVAPPDDLAAWVAGLPGVESVSEPMPVAIGGAPGTRLDIRTDKAVSFGPSWGTCAGCRQVITVLRVHGAWILVVEQLGPENRAHDFDAVVNGLQPVVDSITWM